MNRSPNSDVAAVPPPAAGAQPDPAIIGALDDELAIIARKLVRLDRLFTHVEQRYFTDETCPWRWGQYYNEMLDLAQWFHDIDDEDHTPASRAFRDWLRQRIPSDDDLVQDAWTPIAGLSAPFRYREALLHAALMHFAVATLAFDYVTFDRLQNPCYPEHEEIADRYDSTSRRVRKMLTGDYSGPWSWPRAEAPADLILLRRVWHMWMAGDEAIRHNKLLAQALSCLKARGVRWEAFDNGRSERTWTWVRPRSVSQEDGRT